MRGYLIKDRWVIQQEIKHVKFWYLKWCYKTIDYYDNFFCIYDGL